MRPVMRPRLLSRFMLSRFLPALLVASLSIGAARADDYAFDLPRLAPKAMAAWRAVTPAAYRKIAWIARLEGTAMPMRRVVLDGRATFVGSVCKPHDCGGNSVAFALAADGSSAAGMVEAVAVSPRSAAFGVMTPAVAAALKRELSQ